MRKHKLLNLVIFRPNMTYKVHVHNLQLSKYLLKIVHNFTLILDQGIFRSNQSDLGHFHYIISIIIRGCTPPPLLPPRKDGPGLNLSIINTFKRKTKLEIS